MAQLKQLTQAMHTDINQKFHELQLKLDRLHQHIETNKDHWKTSFPNIMKSKVISVLNEQLRKDEIDAFELNNARNEFDRLKKVFHALNSQPLMFLSHNENNQAQLNKIHLVIPSVIVDNLNCIEDFYTENTIETMEHSDEQLVYTDENRNHSRNTGNYVLDS